MGRGRGPWRSHFSSAHCVHPNSILEEMMRANAIDVGSLDRAGMMTLCERIAGMVAKKCVNICNSSVGNSDYNTGRMHCAQEILEYFSSPNKSGFCSCCGVHQTNTIKHTPTCEWRK